jgi:hypothetical protein
MHSTTACSTLAHNLPESLHPDEVQPLEAAGGSALDAVWTALPSKCVLYLTMKDVTPVIRQKHAATIPHAVPMVPSQTGPPILVINMLAGTCIEASAETAGVRWAYGTISHQRSVANRVVEASVTWPSWSDCTQFACLASCQLGGLLNLAGGFNPLPTHRMQTAGLLTATHSRLTGYKQYYCTTSAQTRFQPGGRYPPSPLSLTRSEEKASPQAVCPLVKPKVCVELHRRKRQVCPAGSIISK